MKNKNKQSQEELPRVEEVVRQFMTPGTKLVYQEKEIIFNSHLTPIKSLKVTISSTESQDMQVLHKLHTLTRSV